MNYLPAHLLMQKPSNTHTHTFIQALTLTCLPASQNRSICAHSLRFDSLPSAVPGKVLHKCHPIMSTANPIWPETLQHKNASRNRFFWFCWMSESSSPPPPWVDLREDHQQQQQQRPATSKKNQPSKYRFQVPDPRAQKDVLWWENEFETFGGSPKRNFFFAWKMVHTLHDERQTNADSNKSKRERQRGSRQDQFLTWKLGGLFRFFG